MLVAGIDIGAGTAKAVIMDDEKILAAVVIPVGGNVSKAMENVTAMALETAGLRLAQLDRVVSTGYGRDAVPFASRSATEIICHAAGVHYRLPGVKTIIDIGAQDSKVIRLDGNGRVADFAMNDKCAAGTGRFLEVMAHVLGVELAEMGPLSLTSQNLCNISSTCTVFAETEIVALRAQGKAVEDLIAGIHRAIASRVIIMGSGIGLEKETAFTGGVAQNIGVKQSLEASGGITCIVPELPQVTGALGAALIARDEAAKG